MEMLEKGMGNVEASQNKIECPQCGSFLAILPKDLGCSFPGDAGVKQKSKVNEAKNREKND